MNSEPRSTVKSQPPWNFSWIVENELAAMACPDTRKNIMYLLEEGITHLVTLSPDTRPFYEKDIGIHYHEIPVEEFEPPTIEQIEYFIRICEEAKKKNQIVGVHCRMGRGRTGVMAACFLIYFYDFNPHSAITNIRLQRPWSIETSTQERIILQYYDHLRSIK